MDWSTCTRNRGGLRFGTSVRPTQVALGWDWTFYKLANFKDADSAKAYMARKPIPYVKYRGLRYVVDHHHTLAALNLAGWDIDVYMEEIFEYDDDIGDDRFWGNMEGKGWSFLLGFGLLSLVARIYPEIV